eukprot:739939-Hanusia_phi.AAC.1
MYLPQTDKAKPSPHWHMDSLHRKFEPQTQTEERSFCLVLFTRRNSNLMLDPKYTSVLACRTSRTVPSVEESWWWVSDERGIRGHFEPDIDEDIRVGWSFKAIALRGWNNRGRWGYEDLGSGWGGLRRGQEGVVLESFEHNTLATQ